MRFRGLDLNLLGALDVLIQERNVSAAARRLNLSQPAMSSALARLREFFGDDILVAKGKRMYPTAFAEALVPQVRRVLGNIDTMLTNRGGFEPATTQRTFRLIASDYIIAAFLVPVVQHLSQIAKGIKLEFAAPTEQGQADLTEGKADLLISPDYYLTGTHPTELLLEESHVVVAWSGNPLIREPLTEQSFLEAGHVGVRIGSIRQPAFADRQLSVMGYARRLELETHSFLTLPLLLHGTSRLAVMQSRLAARLCASYPITIQPLPFAFPMMREMMQVHETRSNDEGLMWLKGLLKHEAAAAAHHSAEAVGQ